METKSLIILKIFLRKNNISVNEVNLIKNDVEKISSLSLNKNIKINFSDNLIFNILTDTYELNSGNVKAASFALTKIGLQIGRNQKILLKRYFDYKNNEYLKKFIKSIKIGIYPKINRKVITTIINKYLIDFSSDAQKLFYNNWKIASSKNNLKKKKDFLLGIYTRLFHMIEMKNLALFDIYRYNEKFIINELGINYAEEFKKYCSLNKARADIGKVSKKFYKKYIEFLNCEIAEKSKTQKLNKTLNQYYFDQNINDKKYILDQGGSIKLLSTEKYSLVSLNIDQKLFDGFSKKEKFYDYLLETITQIYRVLENHKVFTIKIENIFDGKRNIKWELYSYLGIFCEHFIKTKERGLFFKPEALSNDMLRMIGIDSNNSTLLALKDYYKGKLSITRLAKRLKFVGKLTELKSFIKEYSRVYYGFTFADCISIRNGKKFQDTEIPFIENDNILLFVFYKYRIDKRKLPCPACGGLNISGNSFPEIGHKSWECKNIICPERSKSNRGKRYSYKSNYMQWGVLDYNTNNVIPRNIIKKWRRDIVEVSNDNDIIDMLLRYFTFTNETSLFLNFDASIVNIATQIKRNVVILNDSIKRFKLNNVSLVYKSNVKVLPEKNSIFNKYFNKGDYVRRYLIIDKIKKHQKSVKKIKMFIGNKNKKSVKLIEGNCLNILANIRDKTITGAVTSPPYYNAREYSQWGNMYLYLKDMYNIVNQSFRVLKKGGVFIYNIGDISDNENIVVKSTMGTKRILLGAYTVQIFLQSGFELIDNILWDKGEPQSNRQKNDGKNTPHYQKPLNAYEHMFIFKKPGANLIMSNDIIKILPKGWDKNIVQFSPVIKINNKGKNLFGHTAPFPKDIPTFLCRVFTKSRTDIVLDPFSGALTSAISAYKNNRVGLAIELNHEYVKLSKKRAKNENIPIEIVKI